MTISKFNRLTKITAIALLAVTVLLMLCGCSNPAKDSVSGGPGVDAVLANEPGMLESFEPFYRIDNDYADSWSWELDNFRILFDGMYELGTSKEKYNLDLEYPVSTEGLDDLCISASAQFSEKQFGELADTLRTVAGDRKIVIVDLREESHYLLNGIPISYFKLHNWVNLGLAHDEIEKTESELFKSLVGKTITAYMEDDETKQDEQLVITVETAMSERELVENEGFTYLRLPVTDHTWPTPDEIDLFIDYVKSIDPQNTWFHFHCYAGQGRTGVYMTLYDKMQNPHIPEKDILYRHAMTGSNYPLYLGSEGSYKLPLYAEKAQMMPLLLKYVEENHADNYSVKWSEWIEKYEEK